MIRFNIRVAAIALSLPVALVASAALAHHGWGWTQQEESRLSGTIQEISFGNPHMRLLLQTPQGIWSVDLSPPIIAQRSGFGPGSAQAGDVVVLTGHRARDTSVRGFKAETITVDGRTYDVYPQRDKSLRPS